jgi:hypothetical protein
MNIDVFSSIGKTHQVCEDYVMKGDKPFPYVILCDGCSSSRNTDVGARILANSMKMAIEKTYIRPYIAPPSHMTPPPFEYYSLGHTTIAIAKTVSNTMEMNDDCLDATVVVGMLVNNVIWVYVYGDGAILYYDAGRDTIECKEIECRTKMKGDDLDSTVVAQRPHPMSHAGLLYGNGVRSLDNKLPHFVVHHQELIDTRSAQVSGIQAMFASGRFVETLRGHLVARDAKLGKLFIQRIILLFTMAQHAH